MATKQSPASSPTLDIEITDDQYKRAIQGESGSCLIADAIKAQYPHLSAVSVDMATIRVSDRKRGLRFVYLTTPEAQLVLLAFDQGWKNPTEHLRIKRAVKVNVITRAKTGPTSVDKRREVREAKRSALEHKVAAGEELTRGERSSLTQLQKPFEPVERPTGQPPVTAHANAGGGSVPTIVGGEHMKQGDAHPNLLRSRHRHFGARTSQPGTKWTEVVEEAAARIVAERDEAK